MKTLNFSININAPKEKIWKILWNDTTFRQWTSVFSEGSYAVSDWNEGSRVLFLSAEGEGMYSTIARKISNELMSIRHLGIVKDGIEQPETEEIKSWSGAMETYELPEIDGNTKLDVTLDITDDHEQYFKDTFPKALDDIKSLAEN